MDPDFIGGREGIEPPTRGFSVYGDYFACGPVCRRVHRVRSSDDLNVVAANRRANVLARSIKVGIGALTELRGFEGSARLSD